MFVHYIFYRPFEFWTTKKNVYPHHLMEVPQEDRPISDTFMQNHQFDLFKAPRKSRKAQPPKLSKMKEVTKGTRGVRPDNYTVDESKILPHKREGIPNYMDLSLV